MFYFPLFVIRLLKYCTSGRVVMLSMVIISHMNLWINNCSLLPKCLLTDLIRPGDQIFDLSKWLWPISLPSCTGFQSSFHHFPMCLICWFSLRKYRPPCHMSLDLQKGVKDKIASFGWKTVPPWAPGHHCVVKCGFACAGDRIRPVAWLLCDSSHHFTPRCEEVGARCGFAHIASPGTSGDAGTSVPGMSPVEHLLTCEWPASQVRGEASTL